MYELTNMVVEEHVAKMDNINNKKTPSDEQTTTTKNLRQMKKSLNLAII